MINKLKNIEFSHGSLTFLNEQTEQVQNTILGAIFKAVVSDLSVLEHKRLEQMNNPYRAVLCVDEELRVVFRLDDEKIYVMDIVLAYRRERKIELADAIILATAKKLKADLITIDAADFKNLDADVKIITPTFI